MIRHPSIPYVAVALGAGSLIPFFLVVGASAFPRGPAASEWDASVEANAARLLDEGRRAFRHGPSEALWSEGLRLELAFSRLLPADALELGLKLDSDALSPGMVADLRRREVDLESHATMLELLRSQAFVGVTAGFDATGRLAQVGLECALCHSTVDDAIAPSVGRRLDGWANRDIDAGAVLALSHELGPLEELLGTDAAHVRAVLRGFGPGRFDTALGSGAEDDSPLAEPAPLIPPVFGLAGSGREASTHWEELVARLTERVDDAGRRERIVLRPADARGALAAYQLALPAPEPPPGSFDVDAAERGAELFAGRAGCATCHPLPLLGHTQRGGAPGETPATPLRGLWTHARGGYYRDGRFASLDELVQHYDRERGLALAEDEREDLVQFLLSL